MWSASVSPSTSSPSSSDERLGLQKNQEGFDPPADYHQDHRYDNMSMMGLPLNKMMMMDRPSLNLETAVAVRARTRTHETQRTESDHSSSDEDEVYEQEFDLDETSTVVERDEVAMKPLTAVLSSRDRPQAMEIAPNSQHQEHSHDTHHERNQSLFSRILSPEMAQRLFRLTSSYGPSSTPEQMVHPIHSQSLDEVENPASSSAESMVEPLPQRKPPSFVKSSHPRPPSTAHTVVGSIGGAFTRIHPAHEGQSRQVKAVDAQNLSLTWDDATEDFRDSQIHRTGVEEETNTLLGTYDTWIKSMPQMSAIASATKAWQHMDGRTGSVRTATETSASYSGVESSIDDEEDGISLTEQAITSKKKHEFAICCCPESRLSYCMPSCLSHAPDSLKLMLLGSFVLMIMALVIFVLGSIFLRMEENRTNEADHDPHDSLISDEPTYVEAWNTWKSENSNRFLRGP